MSSPILDPHVVLSLWQHGRTARIKPLQLHALLKEVGQTPMLTGRVAVNLEVLLTPEDAQALTAWFVAMNDAHKPERVGRDEEGGR